MSDREKPKAQGDELDKVNLANENKEPRPMFLSASLTAELKYEILTLPVRIRDVFAWTYAKITGLGLQLVTHKLNIKEGTKPVKQAPRHFRPEMEI